MKDITEAQKLTCRKFEDFQREIVKLRNENKALREGIPDEESRMHTGLT